MLGFLCEKERAMLDPPSQAVGINRKRSGRLPLVEIESPLRRDSSAGRAMRTKYSIGTGRSDSRHKPGISTIDVSVIDKQSTQSSRTQCYRDTSSTLTRGTSTPHVHVNHLATLQPLHHTTRNIKSVPLPRAAQPRCRRNLITYRRLHTHNSQPAARLNRNHVTSPTYTATRLK